MFQYPLRKADHAIFLFKVEVMMEGIIRAFKDRVAGVGWIDNQTVQAVREKVSKRCWVQNIYVKWNHKKEIPFKMIWLCADGSIQK